MISRPQEVSGKIEQQISKAIDTFLGKSSISWEPHIRYHDEPIWILRVGESEIVKRIQLALFDEPDGYFFYVIPDHSGLPKEERERLRLEGKKYKIPFPEKFSIDTLVSKLIEVEKLLK